MKTRSFWSFTAPSVLVMVVLLAAPLAYTLFLSVYQCTDQFQMSTVTLSTPFGSQQLTTQTAVLTEAGVPAQVCGWVGLAQYESVMGSEFSKALQFTLLYVVVTVPAVLMGGFALALATNRLTGVYRGIVISAALLPFIVTPLVGALTIKWLFRDDGMLTYALSLLNIQVFWMAEAWSARLLVILYGVWHTLPFAFIIFFAGLQSIPKDSLEAASLDGANKIQQIWYVSLPHLGPLITFILLIHTMDSYKLFEPVVVLTQGTFTESVQFVTYSILLDEGNAYKASAAAILTVMGVFFLLIPILIRAVREHRMGAM